MHWSDYGFNTLIHIHQLESEISIAIIIVAHIVHKHNGEVLKQFEAKKLKKTKLIKIMIFYCLYLTKMTDNFHP